MGQNGLSVIIDFERTKRDEIFSDYRNRDCWDGCGTFSQRSL